MLGVPQGAVLDTLLLSLYNTTLSKVIRRHSNSKFHLYSDNTQLVFHMSHKNAALAFYKLNLCLQDIQKWMSSNMLKVNRDNTEFIISGSHAQLKKLDSHLPVRILSNSMHPAVVIKHLSVRVCVCVCGGGGGGGRLQIFLC